jgi:hypothetical protein
MPNIPLAWLEAVSYLFPSRESAERGEGVGGTAFTVSLPAEDPRLAGRSHQYFVTNAHISAAEAVYARVHSTAGEPRIIELNPKHWFHHPDGDDISITLHPIPKDVVPTAIPASMLLTEEAAQKWGIGPGDEAFLIGRFIASDDGPLNRPVARFGTVASFPPSPVKQGARDGFMQDTILVECRSLSGFSGSPVFCYPAPYIATEDGVPKVRLIEGAPIFLLGVNWGHHPLVETVRSPITHGPTPDGTYVQGNSGMMLVVPAWKLASLLDLPAVRELRRLVEVRDAAAVSDVSPPTSEPDVSAQ